MKERIVFCKLQGSPGVDGRMFFGHNTLNGVMVYLLCCNLDCVGSLNILHNKKSFFLSSSGVSESKYAAQLLTLFFSPAVTSKECRQQFQNLLLILSLKNMLRRHPLENICGYVGVQDALVIRILRFLSSNSHLCWQSATHVTTTTFVMIPPHNTPSPPTPPPWYNVHHPPKTLTFFAINNERHHVCLQSTTKRLAPPTPPPCTKKAKSL